VFIINTSLTYYKSKITQNKKTAKNTLLFNTF
jgi:hypothetical protein